MRRRADHHELGPWLFGDRLLELSGSTFQSLTGSLRQIAT
jgi:hypothetical protein